MINFIPTIGIEVHVALNTKTKMFSCSLNKHMDKPNTLVDVIDLGFPGVLPTVNRMAVVKGIHLANALNMKIHADYIQFDRKNYFYQDLPKGFQITQQYCPIGTDGYLDVFSDLSYEYEKIRIERIHLEEDTAKQTINNNVIELDFNRCGSPLIEIVTKPDIHSAKQAALYLSNLRKVLKFNNISDAKMEQGSMRADINISVAPIGSKTLGTKVEIKNINSINNVVKAIEFEIQRQIGLLLTGHVINQETRRFDEQTSSTIYMRDKSNAIDYCYITEPNITTIKLDKSQIIDILNQQPESISKIRERLYKEGLEENQIELLLDNYELFKWFDLVNKEINDASTVYKWITGELAGLFNKNNLSFETANEFIITNLIDLLNRLNKQEINGKQAKTILECIVNDKLTVQEIIDKFGYRQITDESEILVVTKKVVSENHNIYDDYQVNPTRVIKQLMGLIMKETNGQANPVITSKVVTKFLENMIR